MDYLHLFEPSVKELHPGHSTPLTFQAKRSQSQGSHTLAGQIGDTPLQQLTSRQPTALKDTCKVDLVNK